MAKASRKASKSSELTGNNPAYTLGLTFQIQAMALRWILLSNRIPTGAPLMSLIPAITKPTSPALRPRFLAALGVKIPNLIDYNALCPSTSPAFYRLF